MRKYYAKAKCDGCKEKQNIHSLSGRFTPAICNSCGGKIAYVYQKKDKPKDKKRKWVFKVLASRDD